MKATLRATAHNGIVLHFGMRAALPVERACTCGRRLQRHSEHHNPVEAKPHLFATAFKSSHPEAEEHGVPPAHNTHSKRGKRLAAVRNWSSLCTATLARETAVFIPAAGLLKGSAALRPCSNSFAATSPGPSTAETCKMPWVATAFDPAVGKHSATNPAKDKRGTEKRTQLL